MEPVFKGRAVSCVDIMHVVGWSELHGLLMFQGQADKVGGICWKDSCWDAFGAGRGQKVTHSYFTTFCEENTGLHINAELLVCWLLMDLRSHFSYVTGC